MARKKSSSAPGSPDWFLPEWMDYYGKTQADIERETDWGKATTNDIYHGRTEYYRAILNQAARALNIAPFELLLHPDEAMRIRRMRAMVDEEARLKVAEKQTTFAAEPEKLPGFGNGNGNSKAKLKPRKSG